MFSAQYQQDPDDALQEGVVYKKELDLLIEEGRFTSIPVEKHLPVLHLLGFSDRRQNGHLVNAAIRKRIEADCVLRK